MFSQFLGDHYSVVRVLVTQSCLTLHDPLDCNPSGSSVHGILDCNPSGSSVHGIPGKNTEVGCHALLQGIFPTQGSNLGLLHCRQILYHLSHQGSPDVCNHTYEFIHVQMHVNRSIWVCMCICKYMDIGIFTFLVTYILCSSIGLSHGLFIQSS